MAAYNGHPSWNAWNVALWISNDEGTYRDAVRLSRNLGKDEAARTLLRMLPARTPDGAPYTFTNIRRALVGI